MAWDPKWDAVYKNQAWGRYPPEEVVRFVARSFYGSSKRSDIRILEIGCGTAANLWYVAREGFSAFGIDGSAVALEQARQRIQEENIRIDLKQGDVGHLPYENDLFDAILDIECTYANTRADTQRILQECHRVLKPGGRMFSKTFMVGSTGYGQGKALASEPHTYEEISEHSSHGGRGIVRFTEEKDIKQLYNAFSAVEYDYLIRSDRNRTQEVKEWLITATK